MLSRHEKIEALPSLREVIAAHDLSAQKSLGQNFLLDLNITDKIVREAMRYDSETWEGVHAFEIGPGPGGLTRSLLKSPVCRVSAVELDRRAIKALSSMQSIVSGDLEILEYDALRFDPVVHTVHPRILVANLPYNISTALLIKWLHQIRHDVSSYQSLTLMFQKEVADRITAVPGSKAYGRLSILAQWLCSVDMIYNLPPSAFTPPPKVTSSVVFFKPKKLSDHQPSFDALGHITACAFNQRRKMIRSSLKEYLPAIEKLGLDPTCRAENLTVEEYLAIASFSI